MTKVSIICFSNIDWSFVKQRHQHLMTELGKLDFVENIIFVETLGIRQVNASSHKDWSRILKKVPSYLRTIINPIRQVDRNVYVLTPLALPFWTNFFHLVNEKLLSLLITRARRRLRIKHKTIFWIYLPHPSVYKYVKSHSDIPSIYDCVDEIAAFENVEPAIIRTEESVIEDVDVVFATSKLLFQRIKSIRSDVVLLPNAVGSGFLDVTINKSRRSPKKVLGYVGVIREWFDLELVYAVAREFKDFSIVLIGPSQVELAELLKLPNVSYLGIRAYEEIPEIVSAFDVCLIPFKINELTLATNPVKIYEYFALGKPVVSTPLPEMIAFDKYLYIGEDTDGFIRGIRSAASEDNPHLIQCRIDVARENTWEARGQQVEHLLKTKFDI